MSTQQSRPLPPELIPQLVSMKREPRAFVLHNAKRKPVETMYVGNMLTIPDVGTVREDYLGPDPRTGEDRYQMRSELDADGDPIPGTLVVYDIYTFIPQIGDEELTFDAAKAVCAILGVSRTTDGKLTGATSRYALGGISLLPRRPTKEQWKKAVADGEKRAFLIDVDNARQLMQDEDKANERRRLNGLDLAPPTPAYLEAQFIINQYGTLSQQQASVRAGVEVTTGRSYGGGIFASTSRGVSSPVEDDIEMLEIEVNVIAEEIARKMAKEVASQQNVDEYDLFKRLVNNPKIRLMAKKEGYRIRTRGRQELTDEKLEAAVAAGEKLAGVDNLEGSE